MTAGAAHPDGVPVLHNLVLIAGKECQLKKRHPIRPEDRLVVIETDDTTAHDAALFGSCS